MLVKLNGSCEIFYDILIYVTSWGFKELCSVFLTNSFSTQISQGLCLSNDHTPETSVFGAPDNRDAGICLAQTLITSTYIHLFTTKNIVLINMSMAE